MKLYNYQIQVAQLIQAGKNIILQAPTGAGKTFAALWPFLESWEGYSKPPFPKKCVYSVPMRVLANQFLAEYDNIINNKMVLAYPPTIKRQTGEFREDPEFYRDLTFATIDQVLSSWLIRPYSQSKRKWNINAGAFVGSYLIFDEFHLFDPDSTLPMTLHMLKTLNGISPFLLMTATFSGDMLRELATELNAEPILLTKADLADIPSQNKRRYFHTVDRYLVGEDGVFVDEIVAAHLSQNGRARSLVVCNQVERAQQVYQALKQRPELTGVEVRLLHSRFLREDRQNIEKEIRHEFHKEEENHVFAHDSMILVGTQVVEVGLDMSSYALHTELAPGTAILQRAGRCARYEDEKGHVYVYPVEKFAPYSGKESKQQCELTWEWLQTRDGQHLDFEQEQALINHAHTPSDKRILDGLHGTEWDLRTKIHALWRGEGSRAEASSLIRDIQAVSVVVHADPDQLQHAPFAADSFSLHPGTLQSKFKVWQEEDDARDPDWDDGRLPWLAQKLVEDEDEEDVQGNRPIRYEFKPIKHQSELFAPLVVLHPKLVTYSTELGLVLSPEKIGIQGPDKPWECKTPPFSEKQERAQYGYRLESYELHIELVYQAFVQNWQGWIPAVGYGSWLAWVTAVGHRIEQKYNWQPGIVADMAQLVICLHDA
ncbi:MAG TPA: CRISPR-associated helicase Cas3', partial [Anaerolineae bacterium]|nr:CRISPR-associated helicase Cas3' [Anaerolineae bacterium]